MVLHLPELAFWPNFNVNLSCKLVECWTGAMQFGMQCLQDNMQPFAQNNAELF